MLKIKEKCLNSVLKIWKENFVPEEGHSCGAMTTNPFQVGPTNKPFLIGMALKEFSCKSSCTGSLQGNIRVIRL